MFGRKKVNVPDVPEGFTQADRVRIVGIRVSHLNVNRHFVGMVEQPHMREFEALVHEEVIAPFYVY